MAGCDPLVIQRCLGHSESSTTERHYTHLSLEYMRAELSKLAL
jgi:integrase